MRFVYGIPFAIAWLALVHAVGSGVGLAGAQIAAAWGAHVFGTSRTPAKLDRARGFGMNEGVALGSDLSPLGSALQAWSDGRGADVVALVAGFHRLADEGQVPGRSALLRGDLEDVAGAEILQEPEEQFYGDRTYRARDPEGHIWTFGQTVKAMDPAEWDKAMGWKTTGPMTE